MGRWSACGGSGLERFYCTHNLQCYCFSHRVFIQAGPVRVSADCSALWNNDSHLPRGEFGDHVADYVGHYYPQRALIRAQSIARVPWTLYTSPIGEHECVTIAFCEAPCQLPMNYPCIVNCSCGTVSVTWLLNNTIEKYQKAGLWKYVHDFALNIVFKYLNSLPFNSGGE